MAAESASVVGIAAHPIGPAPDPPVPRRTPAPPARSNRTWPPCGAWSAQDPDAQRCPLGQREHLTEALLDTLLGNQPRFMRIDQLRLRLGAGSRIAEVHGATTRQAGRDDVLGQMTGHQHPGALHVLRVLSRQAGSGQGAVRAIRVDGQAAAGDPALVPQASVMRAPVGLVRNRVCWPSSRCGITVGRISSTTASNNCLWSISGGCWTCSSMLSSAAGATPS